MALHAEGSVETSVSISQVFASLGMVWRLPGAVAMASAGAAGVRADWSRLLAEHAAGLIIFLERGLIFVILNSAVL